MSLMLIRHPSTGDEIEVAEDQYEEVYKGQGYEPVEGFPDLKKMSREELNAHALNIGIPEPESHSSKESLITAINAERHEANPDRPTEGWKAPKRS